LERAAGIDRQFFTDFMAESDFASLVGDPRYNALLHKLNLSD
jgi:hypothetical protein